MKRTRLYMVASLLLLVFLAAGCRGGGDGGSGLSSFKALSAFGFISPAVTGTVNEDAKTISVAVPDLTDLTALTATFTTTGKNVAVEGTEQISGLTKNNFTSPVVYTVTAEDGSNVNYTVTVTLDIVLGTPITSPAVPPITSFSQTLASHDSNLLNANNGYYRENFPGQANVWLIDSDFSLIDGGDLQFHSALDIVFANEITFGTIPQTYGDLTFSGPTMGTSQGVKVAAVSNGRSTGATTSVVDKYSAFLNATSDSRLMQTLNLSGATGAIDLIWVDSVNLYAGNFKGFTPSYRVVLRDSGGNELGVLYSTITDTSTSSTSTSGSHTADLTAYAGQTVVLSFEERSAPVPGRLFNASGAQNLTIIDSVSALDSAKVQYVINGDFELGNLTGWTTNEPAEAQNITSKVEPHDGLDVKRSFYTVPDKLWGRWVDVFENNTVSSITTTINYNTELGSAGYAIIYDTPLTDQKAITVWDGHYFGRDIGMVFGKADQVNYLSATGLNASDGSATIDFYYKNITVPSGGRVALVNFIILGTYDTSLTAADSTARATEIDEEALKIVNNFWTDPQYRDGMTQQQMDAIVNFPH